MPAAAGTEALEATVRNTMERHKAAIPGNIRIKL
jgi:hypothetical protein